MEQAEFWRDRLAALLMQRSGAMKHRCSAAIPLVLAALAWGCTVVDGGGSEAAIPGAPPSGDPTSPSGPEGPREADGILGTDRAATFERHRALVASIESVSADGLGRLGTTWAKELETVRGLYDRASTRTDAYLALVALKNSYHDGHSYLDAGGLTPDGPPSVLPLTVRVEYEGNGAAYVIRSGPPGTAGLIVTRVDGKPVVEAENEHRRWYARGHSPEGLREDFARHLGSRGPSAEPAPAAGTAASLELRDPASGATRTLGLVWSAPAPSTPPADQCPPYAEGCPVDEEGDYAGRAPQFEGLGYCIYAGPQADTRLVRYRTFYYPDAQDPSEKTCLAKRLPRLSYSLDATAAAQLGPRGLLTRDQGELLSKLANDRVTKVVFDVRENTGGDFDGAFFGAFTKAAYKIPSKSFVYGSAFAANPALIAEANLFFLLQDGSPIEGGAGRIQSFLQGNPAAIQSPPVPFYCRTPDCSAAEATLTPQSNVTFQAALVTGPSCFSACDDFVTIFKDNGIAKAVGQPTGAGDSPYSYDVILPLEGGNKATLHLTVGVSFRLDGSTKTLEGNPTPVDVLVRPTAQNRGRYLTEALESIRF